MVLLGFGYTFAYYLLVQMLAGLLQSTGVVGNWFGKKKRGLIMGIPGAKLVAYTFLYWLPFYSSHTAINGEAGNLFDVLGGVVGGILISDRLNARAITADASPRLYNADIKMGSAASDFITITNPSHGSCVFLGRVVMFLLLAMLLEGCAGQPKSIFLLAGQSNMSGRGGVTLTNKTTMTYTWDGVVPPECHRNPAVFRFTREQAWEQAGDPLHKDIDSPFTVGVGPGMPFANTVLQGRPSLETIGLVPCAIGASSLKEWQKGEPHYKALIDRARKSTVAGGAIKALLWYQGEQDTLHQSTSESYGRRFEQFVHDVRADLFSPSLPIIQVAIASPSGSGFFRDTVRAAQLGVRLPNVRCVDALGLPLEPDQVHLTTPSQVLLGEKMALDYILHF